MKNVIVLILIFFMTQAIVNAQPLGWVKSMGGVDFQTAISMAVDDSSNVYTTGFFQGTVDFDPGPFNTYISSKGSFDVFIQKLDDEGNLCWAKSIGSFGLDRVRGIALGDSNHVYVVGYFEETVDFDPGSGVKLVASEGRTDVFILKLDGDGELLWVKTIGGTGREFAAGLTVTEANDVYVIGSFGGAVDFDPDPVNTALLSGGFLDPFTLKLDAGGNFGWVKELGGASTFPFALALDSTENVYTAGTFATTIDIDPGSGRTDLINRGGDDIYVQKLSPNGDFIWGKNYGGPGDDEVHAMVIDKDNRIYLTGFFEQVAVFGANASTSLLTSAGGKDAFVQKLDDQGGFLWAKRIGGLEDDEGEGIAVDGLSNVYTTGHFRGTVNFDPNTGNVPHTSVGSGDIFVQRLDEMGNLVWAKTMGSTTNDQGIAIATDLLDNIYNAGYYSGTTDFDPGQTMENLTPIGSSDVFVQKLGPRGVSIDRFSSTPISLFPNPSKGLFYIELPADQQGAQVEVRDCLGKTIGQYSISQSQNQINLSHLPANVYYLSLTLASGKKHQGKVVLSK